MTLRPNFILRGCYKEIRKQQMCAAKSGADCIISLPLTLFSIVTSEACFGDNISIMEVCPDHVLEGLREKKKWYLRAEIIDNDTYKRAMTVSDYNRSRSVNNL